MSGVCVAGSCELSCQCNLQISQLKRPECKPVNLSSILTHGVIHVLIPTTVMSMLRI